MLLNFAVVALVLVLLGAFACWRPRKWYVVAVLDGDTLLILDDRRRKRRARLFGVDAPEKGQPLHREAKAALQKLVEGTEVTVRLRGTDRYGRSLVTVRAQGRCVATELVALGLAFPTQPGYGGVRYYATKARRQGVWGHAARPHRSWYRRIRRLAWGFGVRSGRG